MIDGQDNNDFRKTKDFGLSHGFMDATASSGAPTPGTGLPGRPL